MKLPFFQIDAFADAPFAGNSAAVTPLARFLPARQMQQIAMENNLSETAFIVRTGPARFDLRWFTPTIEVPLCGHATFASGFVALNYLGVEGDLVTFDTLSGPLSVARAADGQLAMRLPREAPILAPEPDEAVAAAFGAAAEAIYVGDYLTLWFADPDFVRDCRPSIAAIAGLGAATARGPGNVTIAASAAPGQDHDVIVRFFAPCSGIAEDPATGSAFCALAPIVAARTGRNAFRAFQAFPGRGARIDVALGADHVALSGRCAPVIEGWMTL